MDIKTNFYIILLSSVIYTGCGGNIENTYNNNSNNSVETSYSNDNIQDSKENNINNVRHSDATNEILNYLNSLRFKAGLHKLYLNQKLTTASKNHSMYLYYNNESGHYEDSNKDYFTGKLASDRAIYAGYLNRLISENISVGQSDYRHSIDGLFSAIYHRFGFLSLEVDEIGMSQFNKIYTYDMANSLINDRCHQNSYNGGGYIYYNVCKDKKKKISKNDFESRLNYYKASDPKVIVWPPENADNISPVFYDEEPDPLPNYKVSGYPISVEFNNKKISNVSLNAFSLSDKYGNNINLIKLLDKDSDINNKLNDYQFAIFPKNRLEWGSKYYAHLTYNVDNKQYIKDWCFSTRSLKDYANKVYRIDNNSNDITLNIISGESYAVYIVPKDGNDIFNGYNIKYTVDKNSLINGLIDNNTFYFKANGEIGDYIEFTLNNNRKIKFIIRDNDSATTPKNETCSL